MTIEKAASSAAPSAAAASSAAGAAPATASTTTSSTTAKQKKPAAKKATGAGTKSKKTSTASGTTAGGGAGGSANAAKRKKPVKKDTVSVDMILAEGKAAQQDLAQQRTAAAQRQSDPLWYRIEDVLVTCSSDSHMVAGSSSHILPEQVLLVERALAASGLTRADVTPQAMACLLEQARRFAAELLGDAADYAYTAGRPEISKEDLFLAKEMRPDQATAVSVHLPKLHLVAQTVNRAPLPAIPAHCYSGIVLPDPQHQLTARTFDVVSTALDMRKRVQPLPLSPQQQQQSKKKTTSSSGNNNTSSVGYGASRGRQIPIHIKERSKEDKDDGGAKPMDITTTTTTTTTAMTPAASPANASATVASTTTETPSSAAGVASATGDTSSAAAPNAPDPATPPKPPT